MRTTVDRFGRVVVPKAMRERLGLSVGVPIEIEEASDHLSLRRVEEESPLVIKDGVLVFDGTATGNLEAVIVAQREHRIAHLAGLPSA